MINQNAFSKYSLLNITAYPNPAYGTVHFELQSGPSSTSFDGAPSITICEIGGSATGSVGGFTVEHKLVCRQRTPNEWTCDFEASSCTVGADEAMCTLNKESRECTFTILH
jgi:hypothetical protein